MGQDLLPKTATALLLFCSLWNVGCGDAEARVAISEHVEASSFEHSVARLEINGMMCVQACGSKIQKELLELNGVSNADIDFDSQRESNFVEVEFTAELVSVLEMAKKVNAIAGGIYEVVSADVTHYAIAAETP
jgi:copper chaperone CopZ